ncbi:hypothetical protein PtA15_5A790 [Puccinia triticina]|uniref:ClpA/ClpB AAA lid domain-containing protein n=1 Tax=Puccinia triticina TaxID=208348 RepID=A0ABY7CJ17_9BASI|nr:uncharacterized protein PtA15_5A790 [Puccinia triticina]WAQ85216.1 hypothetical protein PtA15_5A790 [Puccinia triticina]
MASPTPSTSGSIAVTPSASRSEDPLAKPGDAQDPPKKLAEFLSVGSSTRPACDDVPADAYSILWCTISDWIGTNLASHTVGYGLRLEWTRSFFFSAWYSSEGLAQRMVNRGVPALLIGRLFALDLGAIQAGMQLIMAGQGASSGGIDAANLTKPLLAQGRLCCLGATTLAEYRKYIEKAVAFKRRFQQVIVNESSVPETISILQGLKEKYETHHGVTILDNAIVTTATLAHRYLTARRLPDNAIDLVDEAAAAV